ncbi:MAG TPA: hypothetical protein VGC96_01220 [Candidatus Elarobacter sp.]
MHYRRAAAYLCAALLLSACGGGGSSPPPSNTGSAPTTSASKASVIGPSGGSVSTAVGALTATLTVPAGAVAAGTNFTITIYAPGTGPHALASTARKTQAVSPGGVEIADVVIDSGGATILLPLTLSLAGAGGPPPGDVARLAGYNAGAFDDVAVVSYASGTYTTTADPNFPGATLASSTEYKFYDAPAATALPGDGTVTVHGSSSSASTGSTITFTASEATANGFPYLGRGFTFTSDNPSAGTIDPNTGVFTPSPRGGNATITATDKQVAARKGTTTVAATSARPAADGTTAQYSGTISENDQNNLIGATPVPNTASYNVSATVVASTDGSGNAVFTSNESDASAVRTVTTQTVATVAYQTSGASTNVRTLNTVATDSNGVKYQTQYGANNGIATVLPETNGSFSNDAAMVYKEYDPGIPSVIDAGDPSLSIQRTVNADGSYVQLNGERTGANAVVDDTSTEAANFSGELDLPAIPGGRKFVFSPPSGNGITYRYYNPITAANPAITNTVPNWIPSSLTQPSVETDTIATGQALDASCAPAAKYGTTATKVTQTVTTADAIFGTLETRTTTSYDVAGPGTICTVVSDTIKTFYDYSVQEGPTPRLFPSNSATTPAEQITISETLSLQSTNAPGTSSTKRAISSIAPGLILPHSLVLSKVEHLVHQKAVQRLTALRATGGSTK